MLRSLTRQFGERVVLPQDSRYEAARRVWNGMVDVRPAAFVRCASPGDVTAAIRSAMDAGLAVAVRGGGHQIAGAAVIADGVVIDLSPMRYADIDQSTATVRVGGGALLADLDRACSRYGVAVPAGVVSHTGVGGLTLGGGIGWLCRSRGLTCDCLVEATVVGADGDVVTASESEHPDLFWAIRGGGGNFGVVTEMVFATSPIEAVTYGLEVIPLASAESALAKHEATHQDLPRELQVMVKLQRFTGHDVEADPNSEPVLTIEWVWSGKAERVPDVAASMCYDSSAMHIQKRRFASIQSQQDHRFPHGSQYFLKPGHLRAVNASTAAGMVEAISLAPPGDPQIEVLRLGGAIADVDENATAYPRRSAELALNVSSRWTNIEESSTQSAWARSTHAALTRGGQPGAYVNFVSPGGPSLEDVYGPTKLTRLREIKRQYDPDDIFAAGVHITPAAR